MLVECPGCYPLSTGLAARLFERLKCRFESFQRLIDYGVVVSGAEEPIVVRVQIEAILDGRRAECLLLVK